MNVERWNEVYLKLRRNIPRRRRRLKSLELTPAGRLLDLGCGDGLNLPLLEEMGVDPGQIYGLDISEDLLVAARSRCPQAHLVRGEIEAIPFEENFFDTILADSVLHHLTDFARVASELRRVLRQGGVLAYIEPHPTAARAWLDRVTMSPLGRCLPYLRYRRISLLEEWDLMTHWLRAKDQFVACLEAAGFRREWSRVTLLDERARLRALR